MLPRSSQPEKTGVQQQQHQPAPNTPLIDSAWAEPRPRLQRLPAPPLNFSQTHQRPHDTHSTSNPLPETYQEPAPPYVPTIIQAHPSTDRHTDYPQTAHYDRRYSYVGGGLPPVGTSRAEYVEMRVYPWPYGYTANNQPLFLQYGTGGADVAARAVCGMGNGYGYCSGYGGEGQEVYYCYGHGGHVGRGYHEMEEHRGGIREGERAIPMGSGRECSEGERVEGEVRRELEGRRENGSGEQSADVGLKPMNKDMRDSTETEGEKIRASEKGEKEGERKRRMDEMDAAYTLEGLRERKERVGEEEGWGQDSANGETRGAQFSHRGSGRISWTAELHGAFLRAVNELGVERAVPMSILKRMGVQGLTREQVASHLQKHRTTLKREQESKERKMLLNVAARSVMMREEGLKKRVMTAEEVIEAVVEQERVNDDAEEEGRKDGGVKGGVENVVSKTSDAKRLKDVQGKARRQRRGTHGHL